MHHLSVAWKSCNYNNNMALKQILNKIKKHKYQPFPNVTRGTTVLYAGRQRFRACLHSSHPEFEHFSFWF
uniref:Uncharacterized protein n=1 Tax=Anguilla anguilla TaxID=7936 RepID=A0A0E9QPE7_ANGAN